MIKKIVHQPSSKPTPLHHSKKRPACQAYQKQNTGCSRSSLTQQPNQSSENQLLPKKQSLKKQFLKTIVSINQEYFHEKLKGGSSAQSRKYKLRLPTQNSKTTYLIDYPKRSTSAKTLQKYNFRPLTAQKINLCFNGDSTYRQEYKGIRSTEKPMKRKTLGSTNQDAPSFKQTQYSHTFLNWGPTNQMSSMKPSNIPATTNLQFSKKTGYQRDYCSDSQSTPVGKLELTKTAQSGFFKNTNKVQIPYMTTSRAEFIEKQITKQMNCKPKINILSTNKCQFKGRTEYECRYQRPEPSQQPLEQITLSELQELIINE